MGKAKGLNQEAAQCIDAVIRAREEVAAAEKLLREANDRLRQFMRAAMVAMGEGEGGHVKIEQPAHTLNPERRKRWHNRQKRRRSVTGELEACYRNPAYLAIARKEGTGKIDRSGGLWLTLEEQRFLARYNDQNKQEVKG